VAKTSFHAQTRQHPDPRLGVSSYETPRLPACPRVPFTVWEKNPASSRWQTSTVISQSWTTTCGLRGDTRERPLKRCMDYRRRLHSRLGSWVDMSPHVCDHFELSGIPFPGKLQKPTFYLPGINPCPSIALFGPSASLGNISPEANGHLPLRLAQARISFYLHFLSPRSPPGGSESQASTFTPTLVLPHSHPRLSLRGPHE